MSFANNDENGDVAVELSAPIVSVAIREFDVVIDFGSLGFLRDSATMKIHTSSGVDEVDPEDDSPSARARLEEGLHSILPVGLEVTLRLFESGVATVSRPGVEGSLLVDIAPLEDYEAWEYRSGDRLVVAMPGGGLG